VDVSLDRLSTLFLTELSRLDAFAAEREDDFALDSGRDDPDVRRLLEAMAFFSARTRSGAIGAVEAAVRRLAAGTLDELLVPTPAAVMVQAMPGDQLIEPFQLPAGLPLQATTKDGRVGIFTTERAMTLLPAETKAVLLTRGPRHVDIVIKVTALRPLSKATTLSFYVRRLDDYRASLALYDAIERHFVQARVESEDVGELPCRVEFGPRSSEQFGPEDEAGDLGPFAAIRSFFQLPEQELFMRVSVPAVPGGWSDLSIRLELEEAFPEEFGVTSDTFQLGVVPCANRWLDFAQPIECDGTRTAYPVRSGEAMLEQVELHEVRGVYRSTGHGLTPIAPAALARHGDAFEFEPAGSADGDSVRLDIAGAFENPCRVQVDAWWSQPRLWSAPAGRIALVPRTRRLPGVTFRALGALHPAHPSPLARDPARCLDVLSLKVRPVLRRRDLIGMLELLGADDDSCYRGTASSIDELESSQASDPEQRAGGIRRVYKLALRCRSVEEEPLLRRVAREAAKLLDAWTEDAVDVEVTTRRQLPGRALLKESA
jgi:type VI secretion system protein ImpG